MEEKAVAELDPILTKAGFTKAVEMIYEDMGLNLSKNLGIEYGGVLNNTNAKVAGKGYYDTANKKIYKCTANTSINYADAAYFIEVSNNDLLGKLQNLNNWTVVTTDEFTVPGPGPGTIKYPIKFKEVAAVIPLQIFDTTGNFSGNVPCVISFNLESCSVDYMDHTIGSKCRCIVIGKI